MARGKASTVMSSVAEQPCAEVTVTVAVCTLASLMAVSSVASTDAPLKAFPSISQANVEAKEASALNATSSGEHPLKMSAWASTVGLGLMPTNWEVDAVHSGVVTVKLTL